jgi:hypothetical protein
MMSSLPRQRCAAEFMLLSVVNAWPLRRCSLSAADRTWGWERRRRGDRVTTVLLESLVGPSQT